jgi:hypothetical protein
LTVNLTESALYEKLISYHHKKFFAVQSRWTVIAFVWGSRGKKLHFCHCKSNHSMYFGLLWSDVYKICCKCSTYLSTDCFTLHYIVWAIISAIVLYQDTIFIQFGLVFISNWYQHVIRPLIWMVKSAEGKCQCFLCTLLQKQHFLRMQESKTTEIQYSFFFFFCGKERKKTPQFSYTR